MLDHINQLVHKKLFRLTHFKQFQIRHAALDISPLDFGIFGTVKDLMPIGTIESDEELKETITSILNDLGKDYIKKVFLAWEKRLQQVIDTNGDYVQ